METPVVSSEQIAALRNSDRLYELLYQAKAIAATIRSATTSNDPPPNDAIPGACWVIENLLNEAGGLITNGPVS